MARNPVHTHGVEDEWQLNQLLTSHGYSNVEGVRQSGKAWHCTATDPTGAEVQLVVDGHGGVHLDDGEDDQPDPA
jgi:hypothetical protein